VVPFVTTTVLPFKSAGPELVDAFEASLAVGLDDRGLFRSALRATLVKRGSDAKVFDRLFELYFTGAKDLVDGLQGSLL